MGINLHVSNLSDETTERDLVDLFSLAGSVYQVRINHDRTTGRPGGTAIVTMRNIEDGNKAITLFNGSSLGNRELVINLPQPRKQRTTSNYDSNTGNGNQSNYSRTFNDGSQRN